MGLINENHIKQANIGDTKEIIKFAYFPKKINESKDVWLKKYIELFEYQRVFVRQYDIANLNTKFETYKIVPSTEWVFKERKCYYQK